MQELTDEDLFVLGVQDFLCNRRSNNKSEPIDTSGTYEEAIKIIKSKYRVVQRIKHNGLFIS